MFPASFRALGSLQLIVSKSAAFLMKTCARVVEWLMLMVGIG